MAWTYNPDDYANSAELVPIGDHRVRIEEVCPKTSSSGNDMWEIKLAVSGYHNYLFYRLVFLPDNPGLTNKWLGELFNSFNIQPGNMQYLSWVGKVGGARVKHDDWGAKVHYFLRREAVDKLPPWHEKHKNGGAPPAAPAVPPPPPAEEAESGYLVESEDVPF